MIWATVSSRYCLCWLYRSSPSLAAKNRINLMSVLTIWWCPWVESSLVLLEEGVCYDQCIFLAKHLCKSWDCLPSNPFPMFPMLYSMLAHWGAETPGGGSQVDLSGNYESWHCCVVVQLLSCVWLSAAPWTAARQAPCPSQSPWACSNSCPLSQWCHSTVSSSVVPFSSCPQSFPAPGYFPMSQLFASGGQVLS